MSNVAEDMDIVQEGSSVAAPGSVDTLPWVEKYRPATLQELVAHEDIICICKQ